MLNERFFSFGKILRTFIKVIMIKFLFAGRWRDLMSFCIWKR